MLGSSMSGRQQQRASTIVRPNPPPLLVDPSTRRRAPDAVQLEQYTPRHFGGPSTKRRCPPPLLRQKIMNGRDALCSNRAQCFGAASGLDAV
jgi:hypothetical protein